MTHTANRVVPIVALAAGVASIILIAVFLLTPAGAVAFWIGLVLGAVAVLLGIVALVRRQHGGFALIGLITGAITVVYSLGNILFALVFIGAISL